MFKRHKNKIIISSLVIIGVFLLISGKLNSENNKKEDLDLDIYTKNIEAKLESFLMSVDGIDNAKVIITLESSFDNESYIGFNQDANDSTDIISPKIRGVAIACTNGDDIEIQIKVTEIAASYLGISSNRIKIVSIN